MTRLFIDPREIRALGCAWIRLWLLIGGSIQVQPMPPERPAMILERKESL